MTLPILHWVSRIFIAAIFIYAGYTKVLAPIQFAAAIEKYQILPPGGVLWVVKTLPWIEIVLGILVLLGVKIRYFAGAAASLLAFFVVVMAVTYARGIEADCGCFGIGEPISPLTLLRDTLFIIPAAFLVAQPWFEARRSMEPVDH
jgi:uncharacterized membrane protein YphA (DoxX/SURF4 family)